MISSRSTSPLDSAKPEVLILGGGFGGLAAARKLDTRKAHVTLLDRTNHHLFQPLLYQVATASLAAPDVAQPLRTILQRKRNLDVHLRAVEVIDLPRRQVHAEGRTFAYDYLVIALGGKTNYFGNDHWAKHATGLKTLEDAQRIRNQLLASLERAETEDLTPEARKALLTTVVVGGGPTGVEMAGTVADLYYRVFPREYRNLDPREARVILIDALPRMLPSYSEKLSASAEKQLRDLGVDVRPGEMVRDVRAGEVDLDDETLHAANIIWAAGIEAHPLTQALGLPLDKGGRLAVRPDGSLPGHPEAFAVGDLVALTDADGQAVPGVAQGAMQLGAHVAHVINHAIDGSDERPPFRYDDRGSMSTIGRSKAVAEIKGYEFAGFSAWLAWLAVHLLFLMGLRNKLTVVLQWFFAYVGLEHGARVLWGRHQADAMQPGSDLKAGTDAGPGDKREPNALDQRAS